MRVRLLGVLVGCGLLVVGACTSQRGGETAAAPSGATQATDPPPTITPTTAPITSQPATTSTTAVPTTPSVSSTTSITTSTSTTVAATTTTPPTTTTAPAPPLDVHKPRCVVQVQPGDTLELIVAAVDRRKVSVASLQAENGIADPDFIEAGALLDVCVGNEIDDITGDQRVPATPPPPAAVAGTGVEAQQQKLNALFAGYGLPPLAVDGDSGRLTEQQLCAARAALHMPISRADMEPGGAEEQALMAATSLSIPAGAPVSSARWGLIDQTCQIMFVGAGSERLVFVFRTSTGEPGHETRNQDASRVFRFDPARENGGWHNSSHYPVPVDNPLNGNMYLPLYFDNGQAIHGANNVPPDPQSKGCARVRVESQDALIDWLGLRDADGPVWDEGRIDFTVSVHGQF